MIRIVIALSLIVSNVLLSMEQSSYLQGNFFGPDLDSTQERVQIFPLEETPSEQRNSSQEGNFYYPRLDSTQELVQIFPLKKTPSQQRNSLKDRLNNKYNEFDALQAALVECKKDLALLAENTTKTVGEIQFFSLKNMQKEQLKYLISAFPADIDSLEKKITFLDRKYRFRLKPSSFEAMSLQERIDYLVYQQQYVLAGRSVRPKEIKSGALFYQDVLAWQNRPAVLGAQVSIPGGDDSKSKKYSPEEIALRKELKKAREAAARKLKSQQENLFPAVVSARVIVNSVKKEGATVVAVEVQSQSLITSASGKALPLKKPTNEVKAVAQNAFSSSFAFRKGCKKRLPLNRVKSKKELSTEEFDAILQEFAPDEEAIKLAKIEEQKEKDRLTNNYTVYASVFSKLIADSTCEYSNLNTEFIDDLYNTMPGVVKLFKELNISSKELDLYKKELHEKGISGQFRNLIDTWEQNKKSLDKEIKKAHSLLQAEESKESKEIMLCQIIMLDSAKTKLEQIHKHLDSIGRFC